MCVCVCVCVCVCIVVVVVVVVVGVGVVVVCFLVFQRLFTFCFLLDRFGVAKSNRYFNEAENVTVTKTSE